jgi:FRG domain
MAHEIIQCAGWRDFSVRATSGLFPKQAFERGVFLFRGVALPEWPLISTFDRWYRDRPRDGKAKASDRLLALFQKEAESTDVPKEFWANEVARLALAQHHGVPTRLLDWTESPYIAAFFAFAAIAHVSQPPDDVAVWCLDTRSPIWSREFGAEILDVPSYGNERLRTQLGRFTLLRAPYDTLEEYVANFSAERSPLWQFRIPSRDLRIALADLDVMGVNYSRIFPGLEGCARAAQLRALLEITGALSNNAMEPTAPSTSSRRGSSRAR